MTLAETFTKARKARQMSQELLAQAAAVSVRTVARAEAGHAISAESLKALCSVLEITPVPDPRPIPQGSASLRVVTNASVGGDQRRNLADIEDFVRARMPGVTLLTATDMDAWRTANALGIWGDQDPRTLGERELRRMSRRWERWANRALFGFPMAYFALATLVLLPLWEKAYPEADPHVILLGALAMAPFAPVALFLQWLLSRASRREDRLMRTAFALDDDDIHVITLKRQFVTVDTTPLSKVTGGERRVTRHGMSYRLDVAGKGSVRMPFMPDDPRIADRLGSLCSQSITVHERDLAEFQENRERLRGEDLLVPRKTSPTYGAL